MSQKSIKIKIGDRTYPLTVSEKEEESVKSSAMMIEKNIAKLKTQFKISDSQDLLAMTCLELATKVQNAPNAEISESKDNSKHLDEILSVLDEALS